MGLHSFVSQRGQGLLCVGVRARVCVPVCVGVGVLTCLRSAACCLPVPARRYLLPARLGQMVVNS